MARLRSAAFAFSLAILAPPAFAQTELVAFANEACITNDADLSAVVAMAQARGWRSLTGRELAERADPSFDGMHTMTGWQAGASDGAVTLIFGEYLHESDAMRAHAAGGATVVQPDADIRTLAQTVPRMAVGTVCAVSVTSDNAMADIEILRGLIVNGSPLGNPYLDGNDPLSDEDLRFWGRRSFRFAVWQQLNEPKTITYVGSSRGGVIRVYNSGRP